MKPFIRKAFEYGSPLMVLLPMGWCIYLTAPAYTPDTKWVMVPVPDPTPRFTTSPRPTPVPRATPTHASRSRQQPVRRAVGRELSITAYCGGGVTASGRVVRPGMVATLSRRIPFGTRVSVEGVGSFIVEDRIGHGSDIDIYMESCTEARRFGRHHALVTFR